MDFGGVPQLKAASIIGEGFPVLQQRPQNLTDLAASGAVFVLTFGLFTAQGLSVVLPKGLLNGLHRGSSVRCKFYHMADALDLGALQRAVGERSQQETLQPERVEMHSTEAVVEENRAQFKQRVKLNVGGTKFETTLSTLTRCPDSMLGAMFSGRHEVPVDDEGYAFIDRDGTQFRTILNFLRTGRLDVPASAQAANELLLELEYYQLPVEGALQTIRTTVAVYTLRTSEMGSRREFIAVHVAAIEEAKSGDSSLRVVGHRAEVGPDQNHSMDGSQKVARIQDGDDFYMYSLLESNAVSSFV